MKDASEKNFGLLIAYVAPGFVALWAVRDISPLVDGWLSSSPTLPAGLESLVFVLLSAITAGMTVSAARWALIDTLHRLTGLKRPAWDDAMLSANLAAFDAVVEWHYRHYQFHANMCVSLALLFTVQFLERPHPDFGAAVGFVLLELLFVATSRDNLRKYYARAARLLDSSPRADRSTTMSNGSKPAKPSDAQKPDADGQKSSGGSK